MKHLLTFVFAVYLAGGALAQTATDTSETETETDVSAQTALESKEKMDEVEEELPFGPIDASEVTLDAFKWLKRPIVVFADTPADPRFQEQMELLLARPEELIKRDVVLIVDTDPRAKSAVRTKLRPRGFMLTLIGKDGGVKLRKPSPWDVREITRSIDKMPLRKQEIREQKEGGTLR